MFSFKEKYYENQKIQMKYIIKLKIKLILLKLVMVYYFQPKSSTWKYC